MPLTGFSIQNYEPGFEQDQVEIFNKRINDLNPNAQHITIEKVLKRHRSQNFHPEQVKYVFNKENMIIGYTELRILGNVHLIFYPLILKKYDSRELRDYLFKAIYDYSVSLKPKSILGVYNFNFHTVHSYFENQNIVKIENKFIRTELSINITTLEKLSSSYPSKILEKDDIKALFRFFKLTNSPLKDSSIDQAYELFDDKSLNSSYAHLVYKNNTIVGFVYFGEFESEGKSKEHFAFIQDAIDKEYIEDIEIRKSILKASLPFLRKHSLSKLNLFVFKPSPALLIYKELGFQENGFGRNIYCFATNNNKKVEPWSNF